MRISRALPWIALVSVWFLWGSTYLGIRVAVETIPPLVMAGVRYVIAGGILTGITCLLARDTVRTFGWPQWRSVLGTSFLLLVVGNGTLCVAERVVPAGVASLIIATVPVWMVMTNALVTGARIAPLAWVGLALGSLGMAALVGLPGGGFPVLPALLILGGCMAWAVGSVYGRVDAQIRRHPLVPAVEMLCGGVMLLVASALTGELRHVDLSAISTPSMIGFAWLVGPGAIVGYSAYVYALRKLPTTVVATYAYVNPIVAITLSALILAEPITRNVLAGGAGIVIAVIVILSAGREAKPRASSSYAPGASGVLDASES